MDYPFMQRDETVIENLHGVMVSDPYRWLEDPDSDDTKSFVSAQNKVSMAYLESCASREKIKKKLTEMWNYPKYSCPYQRGSRYFYFMNSGLQNQSVVYVQDSLDGEPSVFLDPNALSEDGTISISTSAFSEDGEIFAYGLSNSGSDWISIHFRNVATRQDYPEVLEQVKFSSIAWTHDNKGIFYGRYPNEMGKSDGSETTSYENQKLFYHRVGTLQSEDIMVVEFPDHPKWRISAEVSDCGKFLIVLPREDCKDNLAYFAHVPEVINSKVSLKEIVSVFEAEYEYVTNNGDDCIFKTNKDAPNYCLVQIDLNNPNPEKWKTLVPEHCKNVLDWAACINNNKLVLCYISDVKNVLQLYDLEACQYISKLPLDIGTVSGFSGKRKHSEMFYQFTSFLSPGVIYRVDFTEEEFIPKVFKTIEVKGFDSSLYELNQVFYKSKDGTKVPMFIVKGKNTPVDGTAPLLLYGYGGFNVNLMPSFSIARLVFLEHFGGILAIPNIRGGGEYGKSWNEGGQQLNMKNSLNDFQCAAEYLISNGYTSNDRLIVNGGSHGGFLVGACVNQHPELYKAAVAHVGVMDLLRFHKFTIGYCWCSHYGNPEEKEHFENLHRLSPLHNICAPPNGIQYPAVLLLSADHDDRVVPLHSFKYMAQLQYVLGKNSSQTNPLLLRIDTKAGHGRGKPTTKLIEEYTDIFCFVEKAIGIKML